MNTHAGTQTHVPPVAAGDLRKTYPHRIPCLSRFFVVAHRIRIALDARRHSVFDNSEFFVA